MKFLRHAAPRTVLILALCAPFAAAQSTATKPKVRAITGFVRLDREHYRQQAGDALKLLTALRDEFVRAGYEVETVRITTQPFTDYTRGLSRPDALAFLREYDAFIAAESKRIGTEIDANLGPAMVHDNDDPTAVELLTEFLSGSVQANASIIVAGDDGIHWNAVRASARLMKQVSQTSPHSQGTFNFAATAMLLPYGPFFPGSWHDGPGHQFSIGLEGANLVDEAFSAANHDPAKAQRLLTEKLSEHGRVVEQIGNKIAHQTGWSYLGFDPTPAPLKDVSIGAAIEKFTGHPFGSSGTMTAAYIITQAVKAVPVKQVGYSGLMVPVLEDARMAQRWSEGTYGIDSLLAYSSVCGTGLDTVPLPGDVSEEQLARIIGDVASLAVKWHKPLTARLQPVAGRKAGEKSDFDDPYLVNAIIHAMP